LKHAAINCDKFVFYDAITKNDIWSEEYYQKAKSNGDLGQRMHDAFETLLKWVIKTVLLLAVIF
jgi:hypothetical protein